MTTQILNTEVMDILTIQSLLKKVETLEKRIEELELKKQDSAYFDSGFERKRQEAIYKKL